MSRSRSARACGVAALRLGCWAAFAAAAYGCGETGGPGVPPVVFGMTGPVQEAYGANARKGAELAVREINAAGGIDGRTLELRIKDDQASPERAIAMATELLRDPAVVAVAGPVNSKTTIAAGPIYDQGLPAVASSATSPLISQLGDWVFRVASSDSANAIELARRARAMSRRIAVLYANDAYGQGLSETFRTSLDDAAVRVVESDPSPESLEAFRAYPMRLKQTEVD